ncbi:hypothetical protein NC651_014084 [Populus alba x Populus x berolinensis]|nr:hypothetical protein NC651_014084 [Populus alba x Populus x berolinensis]
MIMQLVLLAILLMWSIKASARSPSLAKAKLSSLPWRNQHSSPSWNRTRLLFPRMV